MTNKKALKIVDNANSLLSSNKLLSDCIDVTEKDGGTCRIVSLFAINLLSLTFSQLNDAIRSIITESRDRQTILLVRATNESSECLSCNVSATDYPIDFDFNCLEHKTNKQSFNTILSTINYFDNKNSNDFLCA